MIKLRIARVDELSQLSELCLRSKGHWGYGAEFLEACRGELTLKQHELEQDHIWVAEGPQGVAGVLHVQISDEEAVLDKLFIDPDAIGLGAGRLLFEKAVALAEAHGVKTISIDADPDAESFYNKMGAETVGRVPSTAIEGRTLPFMRYWFSV